MKSIFIRPRRLTPVCLTANEALQLSNIHSHEYSSQVAIIGISLSGCKEPIKAQHDEGQQ